jgi:hypothetical protein
MFQVLDGCVKLVEGGPQEITLLFIELFCHCVLQRTGVVQQGIAYPPGRRFV